MPASRFESQYVCSLNRLRTVEALQPDPKLPLEAVTWPLPTVAIIRVAKKILHQIDSEPIGKYRGRSTDRLELAGISTREKRLVDRLGFGGLARENL